MYIYIYICIYTYIYGCVYVFPQAYMYAYMHLYICNIWIYMYMSIHTYIYSYIYIVNIGANMYIYTHMYVHTYMRNTAAAGAAASQHPASQTLSLDNAPSSLASKHPRFPAPARMLTLTINHLFLIHADDFRWQQAPRWERSQHL